MPTNPLGKGKAVVSAQVPKALADEIERRAGKLHWTKSKYAGELLIRWYEAGCPAVNDNEAILRGEKPRPYPAFNDGFGPMAADAAALSPASGSLGPVEAEEQKRIAAELARAQREKDKAPPVPPAPPPPAPPKGAAKDGG